MFTPPDITQRLLEVPGQLAPKGAFPRNLSVPGARRPLRGGGGGGATRAPSSLTQQIAQLRRMLRDITAINVRLPSTVSPPFRSLNWYFRVSHGAPFIGGSTQGVINFDNNTTVPVGMNAVVTHVLLSVFTPVNNTNVIDLFDVGTTGASWSPPRVVLVANGSVLPGFHQGRVASGVQFTTDAAFNANQGNIHPMLPLASPIPLAAATQLSYGVAPGNAAAASTIMFLEVAGYMYPIEVDADGLRGTCVDRGQ